jgi:hypothetical protein
MKGIFVRQLAKWFAVTCLAVVTAYVVPHIASAQEAGRQNADEVARKLSNPAAANWSMTSNFDFILHGGSVGSASDQTSFSYLFQPALPKKLSSGANILFRPAIPIFISQTFPGSNGFSTESGLGDIAFDLAYGKTNPESGILYFVGMVGTIPTNTVDLVKLWSFGPELALGLIKKWGVVGALMSQQWDVDNAPEKRNILSGQYFYAFSLGGGWQLAAGPTYSYNWESEQLTLPIGTGIAKTIFLGSTPLKLSTQVWYFVEKPDAFGSDFQFRLSIAPVISALW